MVLPIFDEIEKVAGLVEIHSNLGMIQSCLMLIISLEPFFALRSGQELA